MQLDESSQEQTIHGQCLLRYICCICCKNFRVFFLFLQAKVEEEEEVDVVDCCCCEL